MTNDTTELKNCPFCGGAEADGVVRTQQNGMNKDGAFTYWETVCDDCDFCGPACDTWAKSVTAWNTRAAPKVKPLVFETWEHSGTYCDGYEWLSRCLTRSGNFFINRRFSDKLYTLHYGLDRSEQSVGESEEAVIEQANLENCRRILAALE